MLLIIYPSKKINLFLAGKNDNKIMILDKVCNLKQNKDKSNTILIDCNSLNDEGIINEYNFPLEEVFITVSINCVICVNKNKKIEEICNFYKCNLISI